MEIEIELDDEEIEALLELGVLRVVYKFTEEALAGLNRELGRMAKETNDD